MSFFRKIISFILVIATIFSLCVTVCASEYSSYTVANWWDFWVHSSYVSGKSAPDYDGVPIAWLNSSLCSQLSGEICLSSDDGWHHGTEIYDYNVNTGRGVAICTYCGERFKFSGEAVEDAYSSYVSTLDSTVVSSTSSTASNVATFPRLADLSADEGHDIPYSRTTQGSMDVWYFDAGDDFYFWEVWSEPFTVSSTCTLDISLLAEHPEPTSFYGYYLFSYDASSDSLTGRAVDSYKYDSSSGTYKWTSGSAPALSPGTYIFRINSILSSRYFYTYYLPWVQLPSGCSVVGSSADANSRPAALMQSISDYNATDGSSKYYIGTADSSGQITNVYAPNIFVEDTKIFTIPETGQQIQCTDWTYNYFTDYGVGAYLLNVKDGTYSYNGVPIKTIGIEYWDDFLWICGFSQSQSELLELTSNCESDYDAALILTSLAVFMDTYYYTVVNEVEEGQHVHSYSLGSSVSPTCTTSGLMTMVCSECGESYLMTVPPLGHDWKSVKHVDTQYDDDGNIVDVGYSLYECSRCKEQYMDYDDGAGPPASSEDVSFWDRIKNAFLDALASLIENILAFITDVLSAILDLVFDLLSFFFDFLTNTVISGIGNFFSSFTDGSLFEFFQSDDGTGYALPEGVAGVFAFFSSLFMVLPSDLRYLLVFGIGLLFFLAIVKLVKE